MFPRNSQKSVPTRASTQGVVPVSSQPLFSSENNIGDMGEAHASLRPQVSQEAGTFTEYLRKDLSEIAINQSSLSPREQLLADFLTTSDKPDGAFFEKITSNQLVAEEPSLTESSPERVVAAIIEQQTDGACHEMIAQTTEACVRYLRPHGAAYYRDVLERIKNDYELAA